MMKKILIIGLNGFIGKNLYEYFLQYNTYEIIAPPSKELNILDEHAVTQFLKKYSFDIIIHSAIYNPRIDSTKDVTKEFEYNLRMFYNFEKNQQFFGKMLYFGSGAEYDKSNILSDIRETDFPLTIPLNDYGFSKYIINKQIQHSKNILNLRVFALFGKYENWKATFISGACCKAIKNIPITIRQNVYFDYLFIDDFCKIIHYFIDNDVKYKDYNIVSGNKIDLLTIARTVLKVTKMEVPIYICQEGLANEYTASNKRLFEEIGSFSYTPFEQAVEKLYIYYKKNEQMLDLESLLYQ